MRRGLLDADRLSVNPLAFWMSGTGITRTPEVVARAARASADAGFARMKADVPAGSTPAEYLAWLGGLGLAPGIGMFLSTFDGSTPLADDLERARRYAAEQTALGATRTMICAIFVPERTRRPAVGAEHDARRLARVIDDLGTVCRVLVAEGLHPQLHPHVGGWIETEAEVEACLDAIPRVLLGYGPDTGHLTWAGMDVAEHVRRHGDRIGALHLKDVQARALGPQPDGDYSARTLARTVWTEPGRGVVDFDAVFAALPAGFDGELMVEVDVPTVDDPAESLRISRDWATRYFA